MNIKIECMRSYTKREIVLIRLLMSKLEENKEAKAIITKKEIMRIHEDYERFLAKFMNNLVIITQNDENLRYYQLIEYIQIEKEQITFYMNMTAFFSKNAFYIKNYLVLNNRITQDLLLHLLNSKEYKDIIKIDKLKEMTKCEGLYPRFYDFEKYVLQSITQDINKHSGFVLEYHKVKNEVYENAKVVAIDFRLGSKNLHKDNRLPKLVLKTKYSSAYNLQNEIYHFIDQHEIRMFNEYFFSPTLFMKLKRLKPGDIIDVNEFLKIIYSFDDEQVQVEFY
ncbi:MAG: replication initiation protein [Erysipelotrichaceae bacterium]